MIEVNDICDKFGRKKKTKLEKRIQNGKIPKNEEKKNKWSKSTCLSRYYIFLPLLFTVLFIYSRYPLYV